MYICVYVSMYVCVYIYIYIYSIDETKSGKRGLRWQLGAQRPLRSRPLCGLSLRRVRISLEDTLWTSLSHSLIRAIAAECNMM